MNIIDKYKNIVKSNKKTIILPEGNNNKVLMAADKILEEDLVNIILIGDGTLKNNYQNLDKALWIDSKNYELTDKYINNLYELRKNKGMTLEEAKDLILNNNMYFSCMLVLDGKADGIVCGISTPTSYTLRPALQLMKGNEDIISSFFMIDTGNINLGSDGVLFFADCGLNQQPNIDELAIIGKQTINSFKYLMQDVPRVAYLSHSTYGSSKHEMVNKVRCAADKLKELCPNEIIDGEIQLDAALVPEVANIKCPNSPLSGKANILVFPDIDSGNISYKLVERIGNSKAYGPLTQGLKYPVNDLSRGSSVEDIIGVIIITALQANKNML